MTYDEVLNRYRELLADRPGQALVCGDGVVAVYDAATQMVFWAPADEVNNDTVSDFDASAFDPDNGCWDGETLEETVGRIEHPEFVALPKPFVLDEPEKPAPSPTVRSSGPRG
jgi:hypothetical protein